MIHDVQLVISLLAVVGAATLAGRHWDIPASILLVAGGVLLAFVPGLPTLRLNPDLILLIVLPPLVYSAGVATSWPDFRRALRAITALAVGGVLFTATAIAAAAHWIAGLPWAVSFLLGAIVSPPDVVAPLALVGPLTLPRRLVTILNGEGLVNDVTALVLVGFAITAVSTGQFSGPLALGAFALIVIGELAWGLAVGWASLRLRRWADDPRVEITLSLLTPFVAFWPAHELGGSGVLATAVTGLIASWTGPRLISAATRLQGTFFWNLIVYLLTGVIFLFTGLQARAIVADLGTDYTIGMLAVTAAVICVIAVVSRFAWVYASTYIGQIGKSQRRFTWRSPFLLAFTGIRGVVSLVAALSIPFVTAGGAPFPARNLILFLTFSVIFVTLLVQGLALPSLIRRLGLDKVGQEEAVSDEEHELQALAAVEARAIERLPAIGGQLREAVQSDLRVVHEVRQRRADLTRLKPEEARRVREAELAVIEAQRELAWERFTATTITDEARRRIEHELDLEEARIRRAPNEAVPDGN